MELRDAEILLRLSRLATHVEGVDMVFSSGIFAPYSTYSITSPRITSPAVRRKVIRSPVASGIVRDFDVYRFLEGGSMPGGSKRPFPSTSTKMGLVKASGAKSGAMML